MIPKYGNLDPYPGVAETTLHPSEPDLVGLLDTTRKIPALLAAAYFAIAADLSLTLSEKDDAFAAVLRNARGTLYVSHIRIGQLSSATAEGPRDATATHRLQTLDWLTKTIGELIVPYLDRAEASAKHWIPFHPNREIVR